MSANRGNMAWHLHNMVASYLGAATPRVIHRTRDGIMDCYGITVPTDGTSGYAVGCIFRHTDADVVTSGTVDSGDATSLIDATLATTYDTDNELIGFTAVDTNKQIMGIITAYTASTGDITVADWTDYSSTAVANTIYPAAGESFEVIKETTPIALYINCGDDYRGCKFKAYTPSRATIWTVLDHQQGASPQIWNDCPIVEMLVDPGRGIYYFDDYMGTIDVTNDDGWDIDTTTSGAINGVADGEGGQLLVDSAGNASAGDGIQAQLTNCCVKPAAGKTIYFEARVKMRNTGEDSYFIGLAATLGSTNIVTNTAIDDTVDKVGFYRLHSDTADAVSSITARTSADDATADVGTVADATWVKLGFVIDGLTSVKFYVNGALVETGTTAANIPNAAIALMYSAKCGQTSADAELTVDWVKLAQVGPHS